jgi:hypothetical protein
MDPRSVSNRPDVDESRLQNVGPPSDSLPAATQLNPKGPESRWDQRNPMLRTAFGILLFAAWIIATILWIATNIHLVAHGQATNAVTAVGAFALLVLLGCMEGLEVSVVDRWQDLWPGHPTSFLARWLAARQLFVALIVTAATLLADRSVIVIPGTSGRLTGTFATGLFDLAWVTLTVLWFAQVLPKHMAAMNPDRYLRRLRRPLFPIVTFVHTVGISQPGEWTADAAEYWLDWPASPEEAVRRRPAPGQSLAAIWRELGEPRRRKHQKQGSPGRPAQP